MDERLYEWEDIAAGFQDNLIVGNGGAIAVDKDRFSYSSLYSFAKERELLSASVQDIFEQMGKDNPDFERTLYQLWMADFVNSRLISEYQKDNQIRKAYLLVRRSLIKSIHELHPSVMGTSEKLARVAVFLRSFRSIFYLNYDLLLYWATLSSSQKSVHVFDSCFKKLVPGFDKSEYVLRELDSDLLEGMILSNDERGVTKIFYPHGSLLLYETKGKRLERWIGLPSDSTLKSLTHFWTANDNQPIFVCEGTSQDKLRSISESRYLTQVYQKAIPSISGTLVIYGWSMSDQDKHILDRLADCSLKEIAVSLYLSENDDGIVQMREIRKKFERISDANLTFFRADSPGCWCHK